MESVRSCTLACLLLSALGAGFPARAAQPPGRASATEVLVTGWIHVEDLTWRDALVTAEVDGETRAARVTETGRFDLRLPAEAEVVIRFEKPGHLAKEVVLDTHHAQDGAFARRKRHLRFAVVLELERHMAGWTYHSPVGTMGFDAGGGCLAVTHHRDKVPPSRFKPMVF
jgi:hypothetical protein